MEFRTLLLVHNPGAGDEEHEKEELIRRIYSHGFDCRYSSTKSFDFRKIENDVDLLVVAGGDGTIRNITKELLHRKRFEKIWPLALLPLGTANNIAKTLKIEGTEQEVIESWKSSSIRNFDVGLVHAGREQQFFLESFGYGIFPNLMKKMRSVADERMEVPEQKIRTALETLHEIVDESPPFNCELDIDGKTIRGQFLLVEIMNTKSIGPNLLLAPESDTGDGFLDTVIVPYDEKDRFSRFIESRLEGKDLPFDFESIPGKKIRIKSSSEFIHIDDEMIKLPKGEQVTVEMREGLLQFLIHEQ